MLGLFQGIPDERFGYTDFIMNRVQADLTGEEKLALEEGGFSLEGPPLGDEDPLLKSAQELAALREGALTPREGAKLLGMHRKEIMDALLAKPPRLYGIMTENGWRLPKFQFTGTGLLPGLAVLLTGLSRDVHPIALRAWLELPHCDLECQDAKTGTVRSLSPRQWLTSGRSPEVVADLVQEL